MEAQTKKMYSQVYSILNLLGEGYINKLPSNLYSLIKEEKLDDYNPEYDLDTLLEDKTILQDTFSMISLFHYNYWCGTELEKSRLEETYKSNAEKQREKYSSNNLFKNGSDNNNMNKSSAYGSLVERKENIFSKFINKIKSFFE